MTEQKAFISGLAGVSLEVEEQAFFAENRPWGFILFQRNCETKSQISKLCAALREAVDTPDAPIFVDQEGGRVQRLKPPIWPHYPAAQKFTTLFDRNKQAAERAVFLAARLIAHDLYEIGIDANCLPVLDVPQSGAHEVIGDRAYGDDPALIAHLGGLAARGLLEGGVLPVMKHIPGHGRASLDSHFDLPRVNTDLATLQTIDFPPFRALSHLPMAMTAHVVYESLDPTAPCSTSPIVIDTVIRDFIGFNGLLMSDDVSMKALVGEIGERTAQCFAAGCDIVLHCNGDLDEMRQVALNAPVLSGKAADRAKRALGFRQVPEPIDAQGGMEELTLLIVAP